MSPRRISGAPLAPSRTTTSPIASEATSAFLLYDLCRSVASVAGVKHTPCPFLPCVSTAQSPKGSPRTIRNTKCVLIKMISCLVFIVHASDLLDKTTRALQHLSSFGRVCPAGCSAPFLRDQASTTPRIFGLCAGFMRKPRCGKTGIQSATTLSISSCHPRLLTPSSPA